VVLAWLRTLCLVLAALVLATTVAEARYRIRAKVRYDTQDGRSKWYTVEVTMLTGSELNTATKSFRYRGFSNYAVIFWDQNEASVIRVRTVLICGMEFEESCMPILGRMKGTDQQDREWEICTAIFC
jgi:hypothetical protein